MENWSAHLLYQTTSDKLGTDSAIDIQRYANNLRQHKLPVIFSLGHLSNITKIEYNFLHETVNRNREASNYNLFAIRKRSGTRRFIHAVNGKLYYLQKFLNSEILQRIAPHPSSYAFHPSGGIKQCAAMHCGCKWLLQFDLKDFFYTVSEPAVFKIFKNVGYKSLLSFEMARICTTLRLPKSKTFYLKQCDTYLEKNKKFRTYPPQPSLGVLPQGAPTSPMLSNLVSMKLDRLLYEYAQENNFVYTRYADDLTFSASVLPKAKSVGKLKHEVISLIRRAGFVENQDKFRVAGPGSKKNVLGLLVDNERPRLSREFRKRIDRNIYSIEKFGIDNVANHDGFESTFGFFAHLSGLMSFVHDVDLIYWKKLVPRFLKIKEQIKL